MSNANSIDIATVMSSAVHDMKNSLSIILNNLNFLDSEAGLSEQGHHALKQLQDEGLRLNYSFVQLLTLYRLENKQYFLNIDSHNVFDCLEEVVLENESSLSQHKLSAEFTCDEALEWFFDKALLSGILNTILNNACRYANNKILLSANIDESQLVVSISDDGPGYPEKMLAADTPTQRAIDFQSGNTGLGLHFANVVAQLHQNNQQQGYIQVSNQGIDGGGKFSIYLP